MAQAVEIRDYRDEVIGRLTFDEAPAHLQVQRTLAGFHFYFPARCAMRRVIKGQPIPLITDLRGELSAVDGNSLVEIGRVIVDDEISGYWSEDGRGESDSTITLHWRGSFDELAAFEKRRAGRAPQFRLWLRGEISYKFSPQASNLSLRSAPESIRTPHGDVRFSYPAETWIRALRSIGVAQNVIVEIPLPSSPPVPWDEVWQFVAKAREAFDRGGTTGWEACVVACRQALEKWRDIEQPQVGSQNPSQRSKAERIDNLRVALHSCTHVWVHGQSAECSYNEAALVLSTLTALLAERNP